MFALTKEVGMMMRDMQTLAVLFIFSEVALAISLVVACGMHLL